MGDKKMSREIVELKIDLCCSTYTPAWVRATIAVPKEWGEDEHRDCLTLIKREIQDVCGMFERRFLKKQEESDGQAT